MRGVFDRVRNRMIFRSFSDRKCLFPPEEEKVDAAERGGVEREEDYLPWKKERGRTTAYCPICWGLSLCASKLCPPMPPPLLPPCAPPAPPSQLLFPRLRRITKIRYRWIDKPICWRCLLNINTGRRSWSRKRTNYTYLLYYFVEQMCYCISSWISSIIINA